MGVRCVLGSGWPSKSDLVWCCIDELLRLLHLDETRKLRCFTMPRVDKFVGTLKREMANANLSAADLSRLSGVSKASLSLLLNGHTKTLPNALTLLKLGQALGISVDSLLAGIIERSRMKYTSFLCEVSPDGFAPDNKIYQATAHRSTETFSIYICHTVPEYLKTDDILVAELGDRPEVTAYALKMAKVRRQVECSEYMGIILCDSAVLDQLQSRTGIYRGISEHAAVEQISILQSHFDLKSPKIQNVVVSYLKNDITTSFISDCDRFSVTHMGGYLSWRSSIHANHIRERIRTAIRSGCSLREWLSISP